MNTFPRLIAAALLAAGASGVAISAAAAAPVVGLSGDKTLVWFDATDGKVTKKADVSGVDSLIGIDVRPADNMLYGVAGDGTIVTIDLATGAAKAGPKLSTPLPAGTAGMVDFNPMADRMRVMGVDGTNLRVNVADGATTTDGKLNFDAADANAKTAPKVVATAYTNSIGKPDATAMYDIDAGMGALLRQTKPNDGTLATIGKLGVSGATTYAFDIQATAVGQNTAWLVAGKALHKVDLEKGTATKTVDITGFDGEIRDIAVLPAK